MDKNKSHTRRLAAIVFSDITGYTAMMQKDESGSLILLNRYKACLETESAKYNGEIIQYYGDGCLLTFQSAVEAIKCCEALQIAFREEPQVPVRIGVHVGDIINKDGNIFGDAVNVASRVESMGIPGAVLFSESVQRSIKSHPEFHYQSVGSYEFKNVDEPLEIFALSNKGFPIPRKDQMQGKLKAKTEPDQRTRKSFMSMIFLGLGLLVLASMVWYFTNSKPTTSGAEARVPEVPTTIEKSAQGISLAPFETGIFVDERDDKLYPWVQYKNGQKWMSKNLDYGQEKAPCYDNKYSCEELGRFYVWNAAIQACPQGWHLPSYEEWNTLIEMSGGNEVGFTTLLNDSLSGFLAQLNGFLDDDGSFDFQGQAGNYWSSSDINGQSSTRSGQVIFSNGIQDLRIVSGNKKLGLSCRCVEGETKRQMSSREVTSTPSQKENNSLKATSTSSDSRKQQQIPPAAPTTVTNEISESYVSGSVQFEVFDANSGGYRPIPLLPVWNEDISGDLKIGQKKPSKPGTIREYSFKTSETISSESIYRLEFFGNGYAYELSPQPEGNFISLNTYEGQTITGIDADLKIGKRSETSLPASSNQPNNSNITNQEKSFENGAETEIRLILFSKSKLDINNIINKIGRLDHESHYINRLNNTFGDKIANQQEAELKSVGSGLSYRLDKNDPDILPVVIYINKN